MRRIGALLCIAAPGLAVLGGLAALGQVETSTALLAALALLILTGGLSIWHFRKIDRLRLSLSKGADQGTTLLCAGLDSSLLADQAQHSKQRSQLEAAIGGNEAILASLPDPLLMLDQQRQIVRVNPAAAESLGRDLPGRDLCEVLRGPALLEAADAVLAGEANRVLEFAVPGRLERHYMAQFTRLESPAPDGTMAILALHDQTGARRAERLRADFVANASHELRTPLASLVGFIETLSGPARDDKEAQAQFLNIMHDQAQRMTHLVEDLLSLSRIEMKEHRAPSKQVNLDRVLRSVASGLELKARERGMRIELACDDLPPIPGDHDELTQVFQNLIDNAIKYGRNGTAIGVSAESGEGPHRRLGLPGLAIAVQDQGEGIASEHIPRLTERFYRVDTARSRALGGTGLGLAIVKHIVSRHRGELEVKSRPGEGSTFTVYLPADRGPALGLVEETAGDEGIDR